MPSRGVGQRDRVRRTDLVPQLVGLYAFVVALCGAMAGGLNPAVPAALRAAFAIAAVPFVVLIVRTLPTGVYVEPGGVVIRNVLMTRRLMWNEIDRFALGRYRGYGNYRCGVALLARGGQVTISSLNPPFLGDETVLPLIDELNARLGQATGRSFAPAARDL